MVCRQRDCRYDSTEGLFLSRCGARETVLVAINTRRRPFIVFSERRVSVLYVDRESVL